MANQADQTCQSEALMTNFWHTFIAQMNNESAVHQLAKEFQDQVMLVCKAETSKKIPDYTNVDKYLQSNFGISIEYGNECVVYELPSQMWAQIHQVVGSYVNSSYAVRFESILTVMAAIENVTNCIKGRFICPFYSQLEVRLNEFKVISTINRLKLLGQSVLSKYLNSKVKSLEGLSDRLQAIIIDEIVKAGQLKLLKEMSDWQFSQKSKLSLCESVLENYGSRWHQSQEIYDAVRFSILQYGQHAELLDFGFLTKNVPSCAVIGSSLVEGLEEEHVSVDAMQRVYKLAAVFVENPQYRDIFESLVSFIAADVKDAREFLEKYNPDLEDQAIQKLFYNGKEPLFRWVPSYFKNAGSAQIRCWQNQKGFLFKELDYDLRTRTCQRLTGLGSQYDSIAPYWYRTSETSLLDRTYSQSFNAILIEKNVLNKYLASVKSIEKDVKYSKYSIILGYVFLIANALGDNSVKNTGSNYTRNVKACLDHTQELCVGVKGWYDFLKVYQSLPGIYKNNRISNAWAVLRQYAGVDPTEQEFLNKVLECGLDIDLASKEFNSNTYFKLCKLLEVGEPCRSNDLNKALKYITEWFGTDFEGAKIAIEKKAGNSVILKNAAIIASKDIRMKGISVEKLKVWRSHIIRYPKLRELGSLLEKVDPKSTYNSLSDVIDHLGRELYPSLYMDNVSISSDIIESLIISGWSASRIQQAVRYANKAKKEQLIPQVSISNSKYSIETLKIGDFSALYIGNVTGCCQYIGGAGSGAARQSFTESWCDVLVIKSVESGKYLGQAFLWLAADKKTVVLDSIESVHRDGSVNAIVSKAILEWSDKIMDQGFKVAIGQTSCGITYSVYSEIQNLEHTEKKFTFEGPEIYQNPFGRLAYRDAGYLRVLSKIVKVPEAKEIVRPARKRTPKVVLTSE